MDTPGRRHIAILGGGSWGTAMAVLLHGRGHDVGIWELFVERAAAMRANRENKDMLPGIHIPEDILISPDAQKTLRGRNVIVFVVPSHGLRETAKTIVPFLRGDEILVIATKGIEEETLMRMSEVAAEVTGVEQGRITVLVGPSHAEEVSRGVPTTIVASSESEKMAETVQDIFMTPRFRVYTNTDIVGVEAGVALKNVIAIAAGMCDGLGYGDNTKGALLTRGLAEMTRLGVKMGARQATFSGLAGIGDLITTCISQHSRNRFVGQEIGKGRTLKDVLAGMVMVAEGVRTTRSAVGLAEKHEVEMPIASEVYKILFEAKPAEQAMKDLMLRSPKPEIWW
jgi:glycerol-3-phosphate dehydrogenase (NAD(P)+)